MGDAVTAELFSMMISGGNERIEESRDGWKSDYLKHIFTVYRDYR